MSPILLDTHAAIWAAEGALPLSAAKVVEAAALKGELMLSPITAWEIGVLVGKGRLTLAVTAQQFVRAMFNKRGVLIATLTPTIAVAATKLPGGFHPDPADGILIATAAAYGAQLMTRDKAIHRFARTTKHVNVIAC